MPYLNDVLASNEKLNREAKARDSSPRVTRFLFEPDAVIRHLESRIIGQPDMHERIADMLHVVKADIASGHRPLAVFLLVGSTGVGKTETVRALSEAILGSPDQVCRIDMNTLAQEHYAAALTGAPPGYVGSKENHTLFDVEKIEGTYSKPGIVLFDEIEKSSQSVTRTLLNVLDTGILKLSAGTKQIDFRNSLIFMTSNEGARALDSYRKRYARGWRRWFNLKPSRHEETAIVTHALQRKFDLEFINRIDRIICFRSIGLESLDDILSIELALLNKRLSKQGASLRLEPAARLLLMKHHDPRFGARDLHRKLRHELEPALARALNSHSQGKNFVCRCQEVGLVVEPC